MLSLRKGFYVDMAYPDAIFMMPKKKPRVKELTGEEKTQNKAISDIQVIVEHAIAGIERKQITTDMFRSKKFRILFLIQLCYFHVGYGIIIQCAVELDGRKQHISP